MIEGIGVDTRGIPSRVCLSCGGDTFKILVRFDEDNEISWHTTNGYCFGCHAPITVPVAEDPQPWGLGEVDFVDEFDAD